MVEVLVVIASIGILIAILLPAIHMVRESARRISCSNNIRNISISIQEFQSANGVYPVGIYAPDHDKFPSMSWLTQILPYIEQNTIWDQAKKDYQTGSSPFTPHVGLQTVVNLFECPSYPHAGSPQFTHENRLVALTSYVGVNGTNYKTKDGVFFGLHYESEGR